MQTITIMPRIPVILYPVGIAKNRLIRIERRLIDNTPINSLEKTV